MKAMIEETLRHVVRSSGLIMERSEKLPPPPPGSEDVHRMDKLDIEISNWICLKHMFMLAADEKILRLLLSMTPTVIRAPEGEFFLTGDQPVAVYSPSAKLARSEGVALTESDVEISLPLSRDTSFGSTGSPPTRNLCTQNLRKSQNSIGALSLWLRATYSHRT